MSTSQIHARAIATACAVVLIMNLAPTTSNAQVQTIPKVSASPILNTSAAPMPGSATPSNAQINALTNNPNGADWLKKFDRQPKDTPMAMPMPMPMPMNGMDHKMSHKMMMEHRMMMKQMKKGSMSMPMPKPTATQ